MYESLLARIAERPFWIYLPGRGKVPLRKFESAAPTLTEDQFTVPTNDPTTGETIWTPVGEDEASLLVMTGSTGIISIDFDGMLDPTTGQRLHPSTSRALFHDTAAAAGIYFPPTLLMHTSRPGGLQEIYTASTLATSRISLLQPGSGIDAKLDRGYFRLGTFENPTDEPAELTPDQLAFLLDAPHYPTPSSSPSSPATSASYRALLDPTSGVTITENRNVTMHRLLVWLADPSRSTLCPDAAAATHLMRAVYERMHNPPDDFHPFSIYEQMVSSHFDAYRSTSTARFEPWMADAALLLGRPPHTAEAEPGAAPPGGATTDPGEEADGADASGADIPFLGGATSDASIALELIATVGISPDGEPLVMNIPTAKEEMRLWAFVETGEGGGRWERRPGLIVTLSQLNSSAIAQRHIDNARTDDEAEAWQKAFNRLERHAAHKAVQAAAAMLPGVIQYSSPLHLFDRAHHIINTPNGIVDLTHSDGPQIRRARPSDYVSQMTGARFLDLPRAEIETLAAEFQNNLAYSFPNPEKRRYIELMLGMSLLATPNKEQKTFIFEGGTSMAKSTLTEIMLGLLGKNEYGYAVSALKSVYVGGRNNEHPTSIADLRKKRFATHGEEIEPGERLNMGIMKARTSQDSQRTRRMHEDTQDTEVYETSFLRVNYPPALSETGPAIIKRLVRILFTEPIENGQLGYATDLIERTGDAIFTLLCWWANDWAMWKVANNNAAYPVPELILDDTREYIADEDPLSPFITQCLDLTVREFTPNDEVWWAYTEWCTMQSKIPMQRNAFFRALSVEPAQKYAADVPTERNEFGVPTAFTQKPARGRWCAIRYMNIHADTTDPLETDFAL